MIFKGFLTTDSEMRCIIHVARQMEYDGFVDILEEEIEE
jgi:hypothetical protein